jgi:TP901 family phage tail tape measure protein
MASKLYELGLSLAAKLDPSLQKTFNSASKAVSNYDRSINALNKHQNDLDRVMRQRDATVRAARAYQQAKANVRDLAAQMRAAKAPSAELKASFEKAKLAVSQTSAAFQKQMASLRQLQASTGMAGKSLKQLQAEEKQLALAAERAAKAQQMQQRIAAANSMRQAGSGRMASGFGQVAAMAGLGMAATAALKPGMETEQQVSALRAMTQLTEEQLAALQERAITLGRDTVLSADKALIGMNKLIRAGFDVNETSKAMDAMGHIAVMMGKDFDEGTDFALQAIKAFKLDITDASRVADVFANIMQHSGLSAEQASEKLGSIGPQLNALGFSLEESAGMIAVMDKLNIDAEKLKKTVQVLKAPTAKSAKALNELGVSAANADGSAKDTMQILQDLSGALNQLPEATRNAKLVEIFGARDFVAAKGLLDSVANGSLPDMIQSMKQTGTASKMVEKLLDNLAGDFQGLGSAIGTVAVRLYEHLSPIIRGTVQTISKALEVVGNFIQKHETLAKVIGSVALAAGSFLAVMGAANLGLGAMMWTVGSAVGTVLKLVTVFKTLATAARAVALALMANPIGLIVTAITALIAAGVLLYQNWDTVKAKAAELWAWFSEKFPGIADFVTDTFNGIMTQFALIKTSISNLISAVSALFSGDWTAAWEYAKQAVSGLCTWFDTTFPTISGVIKTVFDGISTQVELLKATFNSIVDFIKNVFTGNWGAAWEAAKNVVANAFAGLVNAVKTPINAVISMFNGMLSKIGGVMDYIPGMSKINVPQIPQLASGGIVTAPTMAMVGEGRESEAVLPLSKLESLLSQPQQATSQPVSIVFSPTINVQGKAEPGVVQEMNQALRLSSDQIKREIDNYFRQRQRLSYV